MGRLLLVGIFWLIAFPNNLFAQEPPIAQDSIRTGHVMGELSFPNPNSIIMGYEYDPILNRYIYTEKLGTYNLSVPLILTP